MNSFNIVRNGDSLGLALEGRDGVTVADIGVDKVAETRERGVGEGVSVARAALGVRALEDAHLICKIPVFEGQHSADSGGEVRSVRLEFARLKCALKRAADF